VEAHEASHIVRGPVEAHTPAPPTALEIERAEHQRSENFRRGVALWVAILAVVLAITSLAREHASKEVVVDNIHASDTYNFFQAKNIRQTNNQLAADELEIQMALENPPEPVRTQMLQRLAAYRATVARYESEPSTGEGKKELLVRAQGFEAERDESQHREHSFAYSQALLQIAIVMGSVAILALSRGILALTAGLSAIAIVLLANGYLTLFDLPL
jgi:hypothetical protein